MSSPSSRTQVLIYVFVLLTAASAYAAAPDYDVTREAGDIKGSVTVCGIPAGNILIYAPGTSFSAFSNAAGEFQLSYVQQGTYDLVLLKGQKSIGSITQITVIKKQTIDVGTNDYCDDSDGDGYVASEDCDDTNPAINPGATEECGDGVDNNCTGIADENCAVCTDNDGDDFFAQSGCGTAIDCNDLDSSISPVATEVCDEIDNDCDGEVDESGPNQTYYYIDGDGDGFGDPATAILACIPPDGYIAFGGDCDDGNSSVKPGAAEICDGIDNDCNGSADDAPATQMCGPDPVNAATYCSGAQGCEWECIGQYEDCDGNAQNGCEVDISTDDNCGGCGQACPVDQICVSFQCEVLYRDNDGDGYTTYDDCNDLDPQINPGVYEQCGDNIDNDCDQQVDEYCVTP